MAAIKPKEFSTLVDLLNNRSDNQPNQTAYIFLEEGETESCQLTYQQLDQQAKAIAASLQSIAKPGERALMLYPPGIEFLIAFFGCLYAGMIPVPAYPPRSNHNLTRLESIISDAEANFVLTTTPVLDKIKGKLLKKNQFTPIQYLATETVSTQFASDWKKPAINQDTLAFLQYTSGSTGTPKGVMVTHQNLLHNQRLIKMAMGHSEKTIFVGWLPLFHDMGLVGNVLQPLYLGIPSILMSPVAFLQKPIRWLQAISRYKATTSGGPNFAYDLCVEKIKPEQCDQIDLSSWTVAFNGAEPVRAETLEKFTKTFAPYGFRSQAFYPCYGMAETTLFISGGLQSLSPVLQSVNRTQLQHNIVEPIQDQPDQAVESQTLVGCGQTFFDKILIVDPQSHHRCQPHQVGEVWVAGTSVAQGYWNQPDVTENTFQARLADTGEGPFLRTGDLGYFQQGELFITGRIKDVIIIRGRNHYPQDIEQTVEKSHPALRANSGAAFAVEIDGTEQLVIAQEVERTYIRKLDVDEVVAAIRKAVSEEHELLVAGVILLKTASIPKTSSGKIQRHACKQGYLENTLNVVGSWTGMIEKTSSSTANKPMSKQATPREIQQWIIYWLSQKLKLEPWAIDPSKALADYGLDSVTAVELAEGLGNWLGQSLDMTLAWNFPTIEALATHLATSLLQAKTEVSPQVQQTPQKSLELIDMAQFLDEMSEADIAQLLTQELAMIQQKQAG
jgi:acyl-CoA synthetase (AMP-forming)/AMP-acid ligase II/acyl carrier protein